MVVALVDTVSQRGRRRFVDDAQYFQTGNFTRVFGRLTLGVGEVGRYGDNSLGHRFAQVFFRIGFQLLQHHSGNFFRRVFFIVDFYPIAGFAHVTFNGRDSAGGVGNSLAFSHLPYQTLTVLGEAYNGRGQSAAFRVGDDGRFAAFHYCHYRVCGSQVNTDYFRHDLFLLDCS